MHASLLLALPLLGLALGQDDGGGGCEGAQTANRCCDGDVITSDGNGINTNDISNLICCTGGSGSDFNFGATSCSAGTTPVPFSELPMAGGSSHEGTTVIVSNDSTVVGGSMTDTTMETSTLTSTSAAETSSDAMTSTGMESSASQSDAETSTDSSTGAAAMMTSGPMAGALAMAGGFMMAAL